MNWKLIIFFIVAFGALSYLSLFWQNRHQKVQLHIFNKKIEMGFGLLALGIFIDGSILGAALFWLFT
jgi:hypothetical protein